MTLNEILAEMRVLTGIADLSLDPETRACRLIFGGQNEVEFEEVGAETGGIFFMHAVIGAVPRSSPSPVFSEVLKAGLFGLETGLCSFGYDDVREELVLFQRMDPRHQNMEGFKRELEGFLEVLNRQKRKLIEGLASVFPADEIDPRMHLNAVRG